MRSLKLFSKAMEFKFVIPNKFSFLEVEIAAKFKEGKFL